MSSPGWRWHHHADLATFAFLSATAPPAKAVLDRLKNEGHPSDIVLPALRLCCDSQIATATDARLTRHRFWNLGSSVSPHSRHFSYQAPDPIKAWHVDNIDLNDIFKMAEGCTETSCVARLRVEDKIPSLACSTFFPREWLGTRQDFPFFVLGSWPQRGTWVRLRPASRLLTSFPLCLRTV